MNNRSRSTISAVEIVALQEAATRLLRVLRKENADWTDADALKAIGAPSTHLFRELARSAGFPPRVPAFQAETDAVAALTLQGVWSSLVIAEETGIPESRVRQLLALCPPTYGSAPFGEVPYGSNRRSSDGKVWVPRKITVNGQLSYRGYLYTLGRPYRGRYAKVREECAKVIVVCQGRPCLELAPRHYLKK